jgi:hypothetical protein
LKISKSYNLQTAKGVAMAFDRCVNMGSGGCEQLIEKKIGDNKPEDPESELKIIEKVRNNWSSGQGNYRRINDILNLKRNRRQDL